MKDDAVDKLDESKARDVLNFFAKKAYGSNAEIVVGNSIYVKMSNAIFFLFAFNDSCRGRQLHDISDKDYDFIRLRIFCKHSSLWRDTLKGLTEIAADGKYIAYLPDVNHLLDSSSSIEEALMQIELMELDEK